MNADVVIIGGGIQGCATAYNLAKQGAKVSVIEKDRVSRHASGVNAGGVRLLGRHIAEVALSKASSDLWQTLDEELAEDTGFRARSLINIAADDADMDILRARQQQMHALGYSHEKIIDQQELRARLPHISDFCIGGVVVENDGYAIPYQTSMSFRNAAIKFGVKFYEGEAVQALRRIGHKWIISTPINQFESSHIVNCAGAWADKIAVMIGDNTPLSYSAPMLMITTRMPHFATPVIGAVSRPLSFKQFENGTVLIGGGAKGYGDRDKNRTGLNYGKLANGAKNAIDFFPIMKTASINRMWAGLEAYMPDNLPVIGPSVTHENAWHAFGFSAHGFQMGPIVGKVIADLIIKGKTDFSLDAFKVDRFERKIL